MAGRDETQGPSPALTTRQGSKDLKEVRRHSCCLEQEAAVSITLSGVVQACDVPKVYLCISLFKGFKFQLRHTVVLPYP